MFIVALLLFVVGVWLTGFSFALAPFQALFFVAGILCVAAAIALPVHLTRR